MRIHFINVMWGDDFVDLFLKVGLPSELSPHNLQIYQGTQGIKYKIYTTVVDAEKIKNSLAFAKLKEIVEAEIIIIDQWINENKYVAMNNCHKNAIEIARVESAFLVFTAPDHVWADGAFMNMMKIVEQGYEIIMMGVPRPNTETFVPDFLGHYFHSECIWPSISAKELVRLVMCHLHPYAQSIFWDAEKFNNDLPSHIYWNVSETGFFARCFHLHPLLVKPSNQELPSDSVDGDYIMNACPVFKEIYVVQDSDEIFFASLTSKEDMNGHTDTKSITRIINWAKKHTNSHHRSYVKKIIRFHVDEDLSSWKKIEDQSDKVVDLILEGLYADSDTQNELGYAESIEELVRKCKLINKNKKIAIFGAGISGVNLARILKEYDIYPDMFIDNDSIKWGQLKDDLIIDSPSVINNYIYIIIASSWYAEICEQLKAKGLKRAVDFIIAGFI